MTKVVKTGRFWWIEVSYFTALFVWCSVLVHKTIFLIETGFDSKLAAMALALIGLLGIVVQIVIGALSDRIGPSGPRQFYFLVLLPVMPDCYNFW